MTEKKKILERYAMKLEAFLKAKRELKEVEQQYLNWRKENDKTKSN